MLSGEELYPRGKVATFRILGYTLYIYIGIRVQELQASWYYTTTRLVLFGWVYFSK